MIFETHAHFEDERYDEDREQELEEVRLAGVTRLVNVGSSLSTSKQSIALAHKHDFIYAAVGVHPDNVATLTDADIEKLRDMCHEPEVVALGEIGLDYYYEEPVRQIQQEWFARQLVLAREVKLPVIIHSREAAKDTLDIMQAHRAGEIGGVVHCFSYAKEMAREYLNMDFYFGIGGVITFKNAKKLKEAVQYIPMDKILLETDSPYLSPEPHRGERNSSLNLPFVVEAIAELKGISSEEVVETTERNARKLFGL